MRAWAPVSFIGALSGSVRGRRSDVSGHEKPLAGARGGSARARESAVR